MARTVKPAKLDSVTARSRLKKGRQPHWEQLQPKTHLGYQRAKGSAAGRWILRRYLGQGNKYRVTPLDCIADDAQRADGVDTYLAATKTLPVSTEAAMQRLLEFCGRLQS
jgi:hypothetical protein